MSHTNSGSQTNNDKELDLEQILEMLKQNRELEEQIDILIQLQRIKEEGLAGYAIIQLRVSPALKVLYEKYYAPRENPQKIEAIRQAILRIILDDLILSGKIDTETLRELGYEVPTNLEEILVELKKAKPPIIIVQHIEENQEKTKAEEKKAK